jgi:hypothetical protein
MLGMGYKQYWCKLQQSKAYRRCALNRTTTSATLDEESNNLDAAAAIDSAFPCLVYATIVDFIFFHIFRTTSSTNSMSPLQSWA